MSTSSFLELHSKVLKSLFADSLQIENSAKYRKSISNINREIAHQSKITLNSPSTPKKSLRYSTEVKMTTERRRTKITKKTNDSLTKSHKKKKYQPKVQIKKLRESLWRQARNNQVSEKTPKGDIPFVSVATSTPNCDKTLNDENSSSKSISFPMEKNSTASNSELGEDFTPVLNKVKTTPKNIILSKKNLDYDDHSTVEQVNSKKTTVEEALSNSLKRKRQQLNRKVKNNSNEDKNNLAVNNIENSSKKRKLLKNDEAENKEYQKLEDKKIPNKTSPIKKNKILDKNANTKSAKKMENKTAEKSPQQPLVAVNDNSNSHKTDISSTVNNKMNDSGNNNTNTDKENTKKLKLNKTNQLKQVQSDKNDNHIVDKNLRPRRSNLEPQSNTKNSSIPEKIAVQIVSSKDILANVLFLPPPLKENYKSLRASLSKKNNEGTISSESGRSSTSMSISSSDSDVCITGEMIPDPEDAQEYVHDMSLSVRPAWLKNIMKTAKENNVNSDAKKRGSQGANEQYLLKDKRKKLIENCPISLNGVTTTDLNFFQKVASCPELKTLISKFHFELFVHEQLNSIKNELMREDTKWKINLLLRRALVKDRNENKTADC